MINNELLQTKAQENKKLVGKETKDINRQFTEEKLTTDKHIKILWSGKYKVTMRYHFKSMSKIFKVIMASTSKNVGRRTSCIVGGNRKY